MVKGLNIFKENMELSEKLRAEQAQEQAVKERRQSALEAAVQDFEQSTTDAIHNVTQPTFGMQEKCRGSCNNC